MSDFLRLLPTGGGIRTSRWATDEDRKIGFAELEAKKTAGKVKTHAVFKKDIERYKEENPVYFKPPQGSVSSGKVSDSPQSTVASSPRSLSANALNFTPRKTSTPISNEGKHWMALRDDDLLFGKFWTFQTPSLHHHTSLNLTSPYITLFIQFITKNSFQSTALDPVTLLHFVSVKTSIVNQWDLANNAGTRPLKANSCRCYCISTCGYP